MTCRTSKMILWLFSNILLLLTKIAKYLCPWLSSGKSSVGSVASGQHLSLPPLRQLPQLPVTLIPFSYWALLIKKKKIDDTHHPPPRIKSNLYSLAAHWKFWTDNISTRTKKAPLHFGTQQKVDSNMCNVHPRCMYSLKKKKSKQIKKSSMPG